MVDRIAATLDAGRETGVRLGLIFMVMVEVEGMLCRLLGTLFAVLGPSCVRTSSRPFGERTSLGISIVPLILEDGYLRGRHTVSPRAVQQQSVQHTVRTIILYRKRRGLRGQVSRIFFHPAQHPALS